MPHSTTSLDRLQPPTPGQKNAPCGCQNFDVGLNRDDDLSRHKFLELPVSLLSEHQADMLVGKGFGPRRRLGENTNVRVLRTGDLGQLTQRGLEILGRSDLQVKLSGTCAALSPVRGCQRGAALIVGRHKWILLTVTLLGDHRTPCRAGVRVNLVEVERTLNMHPLVKAAAVTAWPGPTGDLTIHGCPPSPATRGTQLGAVAGGTRAVPSPGGSPRGSTRQGLELNAVMCRAAAGCIRGPCLSCQGCGGG